MVNTGTDRSPERARQDYVKVIYQLAQARPVRAAELARYLGVTRASVSKFKRMLERDKLLYPARRPTDALRLTPRGRDLALCMVRRHRLVETFLHSTLRVPLERVHVEAERIEHAISDDVSARLASFLDHPSVDPHGHRIPARGDRARETAERPLSAFPAGSAVTVTSIDDRNPTAVRRLAALGVLPGFAATLERCDRDVVVVRAGRRRVVLASHDGRRVYCAQVARGHGLQGRRGRA